MLISQLQQQSNRQNAAHSTGPKTPEGKAGVRLNAQTYGLRARSLLIRGENPADYQQLWADLVADWQPRNRTERLHLEAMATSQWLIARMAKGENDIYQADLPAEKQLALLDSVSRQRARLERSFANAMRALEHLQQKQQPQQTGQAVQSPARQPAEPIIPHPDYLMSEAPETHAVFCSPAIPDSR